MFHWDDVVRELKRHDVELLWLRNDRGLPVRRES